MNAVSLTLYKKLYLIRRSEEFIVKHYAENDMKTPMHMSMGQEAIAVGVCDALGEAGQMYATYRSHATFLARTGDVDQFFAELYGKVTGCGRGKAGSMHLAAPGRGHVASSAVVASCLPVAVGHAFANLRRKNGRIACVFFGDGALDEGVFWESLNVAAVMRLPVLFVCEDNGLAVHTAIHQRQGYDSICDVVSKFRCSVHRGEGSDVETVYRLAGEAAGAIRRAGGPAFLYLTCYRYLEHVGIAEDFSVGYRPKAEFDRWYERDCVALQRRRLLDGGFDEAVLIAVEEQLDRAIEAAMARAKAAPLPGVEELYRGVFHEAD